MLRKASWAIYGCSFIDLCRHNRNFYLSYLKLLFRLLKESIIDCCRKALNCTWNAFGETTLLRDLAKWHISVVPSALLKPFFCCTFCTSCTNKFFHCASAGLKQIQALPKKKRKSEGRNLVYGFQSKLIKFKNAGRGRRHFPSPVTLIKCKTWCFYGTLRAWRMPGP